MYLLQNQLLIQYSRCGYKFLRLPNSKKKYNLNQKVYILKDLDVVRRKNEDMMCITMEMPQYQQVQNKKQRGFKHKVP